MLSPGGSKRPTKKSVTIIRNKKGGKQYLNEGGPYLCGGEATNNKVAIQIMLHREILHKDGHLTGPFYTSTYISS